MNSAERWASRRKNAATIARNTPSAWSSFGHLCIHELFEAQVERSPLAVAVTDGNRHVTYAELNARGNRLARRLRGIGVGPDALVGLLVERSIEMVAGILGILKAGGAYVPLDPEYPDDHLGRILDDTHSAAVVTQQHLTGRVDAISRRPVSVVPVDATDAREAEANSFNVVHPGNLAYVMYTSGSSGKPKGVMVTHRNVVYSTCARVAFYRQPIEAFLLLPSFAFDASVAPIFWTLCTGGRLVLPPPGSERDSTLPAVIARDRPSHLLCVSSLYADLLDGASREDLRSIRTVIVGGEVPPAQLSARHREKAPQAQLFNEYGTTEGTVWSTVCEVSDRLPEVPAPIGRPILNSQVYVLDAERQPVPVGVAGELYIGGAGVARGYLDRPELTAERFITDPFCRTPDARLYKSGDVARYRADGTLEFLGRIDDQVKVRGCRIEPEELEAVLVRHPSVRTAAVTAVTEVHGTQLVAYVVLQPNVTPAAADLRAFMRRRVPEFMIPARFVFVAALPTTATGKVNRRVLREPPPEQPSAVTNAEPLPPLERQLEEVWRQVLGVQSVSVSDNFFELGGNSLVAVELFSKIEALTTKQLRLANLLEAPTIAELARILREMPQQAGGSTMVPVQTHGSRSPLFCIGPLGREVCSFQPLADRLGLDQPVYALEVDGVEGDQFEDSSIEALATRYVREIRTVRPHGPYSLIGYSLGGLIALEIALRLRAVGEPVSLLALLNTFNPTYSRVFASIEQFRERMHYLLKRLSAEPHRLRYVTWKMSRIVRRIFLGVWQHLPAPRRAKRPLFRALRDLQDANRLLGRQHVPQPYSGHLTLFRGSGTSDVYPDHALLGWKKFARTIDVYDVPGDHWTMLAEPHVGVLAERLRACLDDAGQRPLGADESDVVRQSPRNWKAASI